MKRMIAFTWAIALVAAAPVAAQDVLQYRAEIAADGPQAGISVIALDPLSGGEAVTGAPYSAEAVTEVTQLLADGNRIERRTTATIARNREGVIRREQQGFAVGAMVAENAQAIVTITDPKTGVHITLNYEQKIAFRMKPGFFTTAVAAEGVAGWSSAMPGPRTGGMVVGGRPVFEAGQRVMPPPPLPPPPPMGMPFDEPIAIETFPAAMTSNVDYKTEQLEPRSLEGLPAQGTRTTVTIPAGAVGNALPIEIVSERWFSPDLKILLMTRRADPRFGETVYRLTNINRSDPSPDLFKVPAGFRIEEPRP